jgi:hypothetical protein
MLLLGPVSAARNGQILDRGLAAHWLREQAHGRASCGRGARAGWRGSGRWPFRRFDEAVALALEYPGAFAAVQEAPAVSTGSAG